MTEPTPKNAFDYYSFITLIMDIIVLNVKFWVACFQAVLKTFLPPEEISVNGRIVLITGTGHGIGKELALKYAGLGAKVLCWDMNEKNNADTVEEIHAAGGQAHAYVLRSLSTYDSRAVYGSQLIKGYGRNIPIRVALSISCNVTNRSEIVELAEKMKKEHGFVSIIVNNAGIMPCHPLMQTTDTEIRNMFEINVLAHFWIMQAFLPEMIEKNCGHFVAMSSCAGLFGIANLVPYCGTKFAVRGMMEALAEELHRINPENNIKMTTIFPYMVDTGLCKKPRYRFPKLMKLVKTKDAASSIINAQRIGLEEASIPRHFVYVDMISRLIPKSAMRIINDFLDAGVDSDL